MAHSTTELPRVNTVRGVKVRARSGRPRLADVPISDIELPESVHLASGILSAPLTVAEDIALLAVVLRPPVLVPISGTTRYRAVGNVRTLEWQLQIAAARSMRKPTVTAAILPESMAQHAHSVPRIQRYLVPLILGELSTRKAGAARRKLREAGIGAPRRSDARTQLRSLVGRPR